MWRIVLLILILASLGACQATSPAQSGDVGQPTTTPCRVDCDSGAIAMTVRDNMFFAKTDITRDAGQPLTIEFTNTSRLPHNIVIVNGDMAVATEVNRDAINQVDYLPQHPAVVASIPMVMPNQTGSITWESTQPGTYLFICTYPGHFDAGMYGTITVK
jgi:uncharacterized cupredoxin-like copper-binding protein